MGTGKITEWVSGINIAWVEIVFVTSKKEMKDETTPPIKDIKIGLYHIP